MYQYKRASIKEKQYNRGNSENRGCSKQGNS